MYDSVESSKVLYLEAGSYTAKILRLGEGIGLTRFDRFDLVAWIPPRQSQIAGWITKPGQ